jgi:hypothetical protein
MSRAAIFRSIFFTAYSAAIGVGLVTLMYLHDPADRVGTAFWGLVLTAIFGTMGWGIANDTEWSNLRRFMVISLAPVCLVAAVFGTAVILIWSAVVVVPIVMVGAFKEQRRFRNLMKSNGRFLNDFDLSVRLKAGQGTLIEETGRKGPYRIWWTEEDVLEEGTPPSTTEEYNAIMQGEEHPFNSKCLNDYLDPIAGKAFLTDTTPRATKSGTFARKYPAVRVVMLVRRPF